MSDKINLKDFKKEYSSLIGKEVYLLSKSNVRYQGILQLIEPSQVWLKSGKKYDFFKLKYFNINC
jgi:ferredoxin-fold anticodon binding domain-containing protein